MHGQMEFPNTSPEAIDLNASCSKQADSSGLGTGHGCENTEPGCIFTEIRVSSTGRHQTDAQYSSVK